MPNIRESDLPGIGRKFQVETRSGDKLVIIIHDDGKRELYHFDHDDPDESISMVTLDDAEARLVAGIVGGMTYMPRALETAEVALSDLIIDWQKVEVGSPCVGRSIGDLQIRQHTGASIMAVINKDHSKTINPGPDHVVQAESTLVVAGERSQVKACRQLLTKGVS